MIKGKIDTIADNFLPENCPFAIFGAQVVAYGAYIAIRALYGRVPECFATSTAEGNQAEIDQIPVRNVQSLPRSMPLLVAVTELIQKEVLPMLSEMGFERLYALTQHEEHLLMSSYFSMRGEFPVLEQKRKERPVELTLYEVKNHRDKPLAHSAELFSFERPIQAGAALTQQRIAPLADDTGKTISAKNRQYCEMSAVYWIWKNARHDWVGIEHYRRHLLVRPEWIGEEVDAVLPLPYLCYPNEASQFLRFTTENVFTALLQALRHLHPDEYPAYHDILFGSYQYTYNLLCARWEVFDRYCSWFFEITEYMEQMSNQVLEIKDSRALSYVAEVLTNLFFMSQRKSLHILHAEKAIFI